MVAVRVVSSPSNIRVAAVVVTGCDTPNTFTTSKGPLDGTAPHAVASCLVRADIWAPVSTKNVSNLFLGLGASIRRCLCFRYQWAVQHKSSPVHTRGAELPFSLFCLAHFLACLCQLKGVCSGSDYTFLPLVSQAFCPAVVIPPLLTCPGENIHQFLKIPSANLVTKMPLAPTKPDWHREESCVKSSKQIRWPRLERHRSSNFEVLLWSPWHAFSSPSAPGAVGSSTVSTLTWS